MDTTPVHALTIYQEDVKDNTPATGNPFARGVLGHRCRLAVVGQGSTGPVPRRRPVLSTAECPVRTTYGSDRARWLAARS